MIRGDEGTGDGVAAEVLTEDFSLRHRSTRALLERERDLAELDALLTDARAGRGCLSLIEGPAGIGKSALMGAARERALAEGMTVLGARGGELERDFPFGIVRQLFEPVLMRADRDGREALTAGAAGLVEPVLGHGSGGARAADPSHAVLHGLYWLTANLAERSPTLIAVDDLHWVDGPSLRFLLHLARRLDGMPVTVLTATRKGEGTADPDPFQELLLEARRPPIRPAPLSVNAIERLLEERLERRPEPSLGRACREATGGNPFLLAELVGELRARDAPAGRIDPDEIKRLGPERIATALLLRIGRLDREAPALARSIAVLGEDAGLAAAAELAALEPERARCLARLLCDASVLDRDDPPRFVHPIVRAAVYEDIPLQRRAAMHGRAGRLLRAEGSGPAVIAVHLLASDPAGDAGVVETLREAACDAMRRGAPDTAVRLLRRALAEPPGARERPELLFELGLAERELGSPSAVAHLIAAIELTSDPLARARITNALAWATGPDPAAHRKHLPLYERAADDVRPRDRELALTLEAARLFSLLLNPDVPTRFTDEAERFRALAGETQAECLLLSFVARKALMSGDTADEVGRLAERAASHPALASGGTPASWLVNVIVCLNAAERYEAAERILTHAIRLAERSGSVWSFAHASRMRGMVRHALGDLRGAEADGRALDGQGVGTFPASALIPLMEVFADQGRAEEGEALLEEHGLGKEIPPVRPMTPLLIARGRMRAAGGDLVAGRADLEQALRRLEASGSGGPLGLDAKLALALVLQRLGEAGAARRISDAALATARAWRTPRALGGALRVAGLVRGGEGGLGLLRMAVDTLADSPALLWRAEALVDLGARLRRDGRRADARSVLAQGLDLADRAAATPVIARAQEELSLSGARPRRRALSGRASLTPSELRVAEMAAGGMANKEIAQALFVTLRTIEMHLSNAYGKLAIRSRGELARALEGSPRSPLAARHG